MNPVSYTHLDVYKRQVNDSQIVLHMDGIKLTLLCTQGTSDTAGRTDSFYIFAFVVGAALYQICLLYTSRCV